MVIGFADVDWYRLTSYTERQRLRRITRNAASSRKIIGSSKWHNSQNGSRRLGEIHQAMNDLVQCSVPAGCNHQIRCVCFRHKSARVSLFPGHSHFNAMSGCSLPRNCGAESVIPGHFPVENQANPFASCFGFHRHGRAVRKTLRLCKQRQARAQKMTGNSQLLRSRNPICPEKWKHEDANHAPAYQRQ